MGWKEVNTNAFDIKKTKEPFEGKFTGSKHISTNYGDQVIWMFEGKEDGLPIGIYGFTNLNRAMEALSPGTLVRIQYQGKELTETKKFGKTEVHQVSVQAFVPENPDEGLPF